MTRKSSKTGLALAALLLTWLQPPALAGGLEVHAPGAAQIVARNIAARGGAEAWRKVDTLVYVGHLQSDQAPVPDMGFMLEQKRPNKTRFELLGMDQKSVRVFDGRQGWILKSGRGEATAPRPYSRQDLEFAEHAPGLAGPLIDAAAQRSQITLEASDRIDGRPAYRLAVRRAGGETDHVWIDATTFLDLRYDRPVPGGESPGRVVSVYYSDYRVVAGVKLPAVIETASAPGRTPDRMTIEQLVVNSPLEDSVFTPYGGPMGRGGRRSVMLTPTAPTPPTAGTAVRDGASGQAQPGPGGR